MEQITSWPCKPFSLVCIRSLVSAPLALSFVALNGKGASPLGSSNVGPGFINPSLFVGVVSGKPSLLEGSPPQFIGRIYTSEINITPQIIMDPQKKGSFPERSCPKREGLHLPAAPKGPCVEAPLELKCPKVSVASNSPQGRLQSVPGVRIMHVGYVGGYGLQVQVHGM